MRNSRAQSNASNRRARRLPPAAISGAVGTFAHVDPRVEAHVAKKMGLAVEPISTQIIPRDRHAMYFATLARRRLLRRAAWRPKSVTCSAPKCWKPRNSSRKAKRAPPPCRTSAIRCCRRTWPGSPAWCAPMSTPALENVALWHERDISHSSVERMIGPDATVTLDFALGAARRHHRQAHRLSRQHAEEPRPARRARPFAARAAGADAKRRGAARTPIGWFSAMR